MIDVIAIVRRSRRGYKSQIAAVRRSTESGRSLVATQSRHASAR
jgi:hypothetical protein